MLMTFKAKPRSPQNSPRLAIVIGSGGVRSIASLGMIDVLFEQGIRPELIVGCSAGAIFGALIAAGYSVQESMARSTKPWTDELTNQKRWASYGQIALPRLFRFNQDFSLLKDNRIMEHLHTAFRNLEIEQLLTTLRICATDASAGNSVTIDSGKLVQALRASIALPFIFSPIKVNDRWLVDGVVSDPLPINAATDADTVIAMGFESAMLRNINSISRLIMQTRTAAINNLQQARIASAKSSGPPTVFIMPKLDRRIGLFQTSAMPYLFDAGRKATLNMLPEIRAMLNKA